ncbi:uncharacterized protein LOC111113603 [Crassostrea virginica]
MSTLLVLSLILSLATGCERFDGVMSCDKLPDHLDRMEGIRILVVKRTLRRSVDLRQFPLEKVQFRSTEMTCDNVKTQPTTQVFLREKLCSSPAYIHESTTLTTTLITLTTTLTTMTESAVVSFNTPWIFAAGISSFVVCLLGVCIALVFIVRRCVRVRRHRAARTAMDDISVTEFSQFQFQSVKLD